MEDKGQPETCFFFFLISATIAEAAAVIKTAAGAKTFFAKGMLLSLKDQLNYLIMILRILQTELF